jgi:AraC family transcriptional regulator
MKKSLDTNCIGGRYNTEINRPNKVEPINEAISGIIQIEDYHIPSQLLEGAPHRDTIIISKSLLPSAWRELGGERRDSPLKISDVIINPANVAHSTCWDGEVSFTLFSIDSDFLKHTAYEYMNPDNVNLLPRFPQSDPLIYGIVHAINVQIHSQEPNGQLYIDNLISTLVIHLLKKYCSTAYHLAENNYALSDMEKQLIIDYIEVNLDRKVGLVELASLLNMSRYHFTRLFKESMGICPSQYSIERRLKKATCLLKNTKLSIGEITQKVGFSSQSHFSSLFSKKMQATPAQYRKML